MALAFTALAADPRPRTLPELVLHVVKTGTDDVLGVNTASFLGLKREGPIRVVWAEGAKVPRRSFAVAYWTPKKGAIKPAAIVLLVTDRVRKSKRETLVEGRAYLATLEGKLARALTSVHKLQGGGTTEDDDRLPIDSPDVRRKFERELRYWLDGTDEPSWKGRR